VVPGKQRSAALDPTGTKVRLLRRRLEEVPLALRSSFAKAPPCDKIKSSVHSGRGRFGASLFHAKCKVLLGLPITKNPRFSEVVCGDYNNGKNSGFVRFFAKLCSKFY